MTNRVPARTGQDSLLVSFRVMMESRAGRFTHNETRRNDPQSLTLPLASTPGSDADWIAENGQRSDARKTWHTRVHPSEAKSLRWGLRGEGLNSLMSDCKRDRHQAQRTGTDGRASAERSDQEDLMRNQKVWYRQGGVPRRLARRGNNHRLQQIITGDQERHWRQVRHHECLHNGRQQRSDCNRLATSLRNRLPAWTSPRTMSRRTMTAARNGFAFASGSSLARCKLVLVAAGAQALFGSLLTCGPAARIQVALAERLVLTIGADAGHPGRSGHERDRDHRPDQRRPEVLPNGAHLSKPDEESKHEPCVDALRREPIHDPTIYRRPTQNASACPNSTLHAPFVQYGCKCGAVLAHSSMQAADGGYEKRCQFAAKQPKRATLPVLLDVTGFSDRSL